MESIEKKIYELDILINLAIIKSLRMGIIATIFTALAIGLFFSAYFLYDIGSWPDNPKSSELTQDDIMVLIYVMGRVGLYFTFAVFTISFTSIMWGYYKSIQYMRKIIDILNKLQPFLSKTDE